MSTARESGRIRAVVPIALRSEGADALLPRSAAKRVDILGAALDLFAEHGFAGTGMREIATRAGVSTATIYAHFPNKRALLRALIEERWHQALSGTLARAAALGDPLERLLFGVTHLNHAISSDPLLCQLLVTPQRVGDAQIEKRVAPIEDMMDAQCAAAIRAAVQAKRLECADPDALAVLIRVSMQGWLLREARRRKPMSEERVTRVLVGLIRAATTTKRRAPGTR